MKRLILSTLSAALVLSGGVAVSSADAQSPTPRRVPQTWLVSHASGSYESSDGANYRPSIGSGDLGRGVVAFLSEADNLKPAGWMLGRPDLWNIETRFLPPNTVLNHTIPYHAAGQSSSSPINESVDRGVISGDGDHLAFVSGATDILSAGAGLVLGRDQVFVASSGQSQLVSQNDLGTPADVAADPDVAIDDDGRYVAFSTGASNLILDGGQQNPDHTPLSDVYLRDTQTRTTTLVSVDQMGRQPENDPNGWAKFPSVSDDGCRIAFESTLQALHPAKQPGHTPDIYVRDRCQNRTILVSLGTDGRSANGSSSDPDISPDGRYVVYGSDATNLINFPAGNEPSRYNIYRHDLLTGTTVLVSHAPNQPLVPADGHSSEPAISWSGQEVAFTSDATNLAPAGTHVADSHNHIYQWRNGQAALPSLLPIDRRTPEFARDLPLGDQADESAWHPAMTRSSDDPYGRYVVFSSYASNLISYPSYRNRFSRAEIYMRDVFGRRPAAIPNNGRILLFNPRPPRTPRGPAVDTTSGPIVDTTSQSGGLPRGPVVQPRPAPRTVGPRELTRGGR